jgi:hypothetical protein
MTMTPFRMQYLVVFVLWLAVNLMAFVIIARANAQVYQQIPGQIQPYIVQPRIYTEPYADGYPIQRPQTCTQRCERSGRNETICTTTCN